MNAPTAPRPLPPNRAVWAFLLITSTFLAGWSANMLCGTAVFFEDSKSAPLTGRDGSITIGFMLIQVIITLIPTLPFLVTMGFLVRSTWKWRHWAPWLATVLLPGLSAACGVALELA
ncbi:MAG: hypothetical protein MUC96_08825 [Myxococcaceae bacterium]|nr:hypothetical protein [Myxococcaceae bacterium]